MRRTDTREARFERLADVVYEPLQRYLGRRAHPHDADEVLNDALTVLWRRLDDVPRDDPLPWSYRVARHCLANHRRGAQRRLRLIDRIGAQRAPSATIADPEPPADELGAALAALGPDDRELLRLWAWEGLEPREMAVVLDVTPNAVSLRLGRARRRLAAHLGHSDDTGRQDAVVAGQEPDGHGKEQRS